MIPIRQSLANIDKCVLFIVTPEYLYKAWDEKSKCNKLSENNLYVLWLVM